MSISETGIKVITFLISRRKQELPFKSAIEQSWTQNPVMRP